MPDHEFQSFLSASGSNFVLDQFHFHLRGTIVLELKLEWSQIIIILQAINMRILYSHLIEMFHPDSPDSIFSKLRHFGFYLGLESKAGQIYYPNPNLNPSYFARCIWSNEGKQVCEDFT